MRRAAVLGVRTLAGLQDHYNAHVFLCRRRAAKIFKCSSQHLVLKFGNYDKVCGAVFLNTRLPTDRRSRVHAHRTTAAGDCENRNSSRVHHGPDGHNNRRNPTKSNRDSKNGTRNKELPDEVKGPLGTGLPTKQRGRGRDRG